MGVLGEGDEGPACGKVSGAALGTHRSRSIQDGQPHGLAFGVQRNSRTLQLWQGGLAQAGPLRLQTSNLRLQISGLGQQILEALAQRLSNRDVAPNKPRPCDGARVWGNTEVARCKMQGAVQ